MTKTAINNELLIPDLWTELKESDVVWFLRRVDYGVKLILFYLS